VQLHDEQPDPWQQDYSADGEHSRQYQGSAVHKLIIPATLPANKSVSEHFLDKEAVRNSSPRRPTESDPSLALGVGPRASRARLGDEWSTGSICPVRF